MNATSSSGKLVPILNCYLRIGAQNIEGENPLYFNNIPDLGDSKSASYNAEGVIGRAAPINTYANSDNRSISLSINLFVQDITDCKKNLRILRRIQSAVYPRSGLNSPGAPYFPPPVCQLKCGSLLSEKPICCIMKDYNAKFPTDVPWDEETLCPYRLEISMTFEAVYASQDLPNNDLILQDIPI
jgi:hypothetical protein